MKKMKLDAIKICNVILALLIIAVLVCQFLPNWTLKDQTISVGEYVWRPHEHKDFTKNFQKTLDTELDSGSVAGMHIIFLVGGIFGLWFTITKCGTLLPSAIFAVSGIWGVIELTKNPILKVGSQYNLLQLLGIILLVAAVATVLLGIVLNVLKIVKAKKAIA